MNKYEKNYCLTGTKESNWINLCIVPLCSDIAEATGFDVKFYGPFGLRAEVNIFINDEKGEPHGLTITASYKDNEMTLYYDTGKISRKYISGSIAEVNGLYNETTRLPETLEEIIMLFKIN